MLILDFQYILVCNTEVCLL